ncbi:hypothetical protein EDEG_00658 [Edhazardia aedis USNM 41457]|uniref:Uncharacterized protein n=1 Tax=Edhazardia aedis (strain USNM 41457) TaxID=1003232 RepID=J9DVG8_EDHAE|nr:hypothetical protein EDEG_00658 [Edhazardia aedis USNM 41457]|eukprot:EJW05282.1 hypothetical protein EDEG_00658 [Edhazardia aedis USNM 41457]
MNIFFNFIFIPIILSKQQLNIKSCHNHTKTSIFYIDVHCDQLVLEDIQEYVNSVRGLSLNTNSAAIMFFGSIFDELNITLLPSDIQIHGKFSQLSTADLNIEDDEKLCSLESPAIIRGNKALQVLNYLKNGVIGNKIFVFHCDKGFSLQDNIILDAGPCSSILSMTYTIPEMISEDLKSKLLGLILKNNQFDLKNLVLIDLDDKICEVAEKCINFYETNLGKNVLGNQLIKNVPTNLKNLQQKFIDNIANDVLDDIEDDINAILESPTDDYLNNNPMLNNPFQASQFQNKNYSFPKSNDLIPIPLSLDNKKIFGDLLSKPESKNSLSNNNIKNLPSKTDNSSTKSLESNKANNIKQSLKTDIPQELKSGKSKIAPKLKSSLLPEKIKKEKKLSALSPKQEEKSFEDRLKDLLAKVRKTPENLTPKEYKNDNTSHFPDKTIKKSLLEKIVETSSLSKNQNKMQKNDNYNGLDSDKGLKTALIAEKFKPIDFKKSNNTMSDFVLKPSVPISEERRPFENKIINDLINNNTKSTKNINPLETLINHELQKNIVEKNVLKSLSGAKINMANHLEDALLIPKNTNLKETTKIEENDPEYSKYIDNLLNKKHNFDFIESLDLNRQKELYLKQRKLFGHDASATLESDRTGLPDVNSISLIKEKSELQELAHRYAERENLAGKLANRLLAKNSFDLYGYKKDSRYANRNMASDSFGNSVRSKEELKYNENNAANSSISKKMALNGIENSRNSRNSVDLNVYNIDTDSVERKTFKNESSSKYMKNNLSTGNLKSENIFKNKSQMDKNSNFDTKGKGKNAKSNSKNIRSANNNSKSLGLDIYDPNQVPGPSKKSD